MLGRGRNEHPLRPLDKTVAVLNMDMIGRNMEVPVGGGRRFTGLRCRAPSRTATASTSSASLEVPRSRRRSTRPTRRGPEAQDGPGQQRVESRWRRDQWPFLQRGIPAIWFHSGLHPDYHGERPAGKDQLEKMEKIARLVHQLSWDLAQQPGEAHVIE